MIIRRCAGGVVFYANKVLIVKNDRNEWTLPKGKVFEGELPYESAISRVKEETNINARCMHLAGDTMYEFFSRSRQQQVCNAIMWYIMDTDNTQLKLVDDFQEGGFYKIKEAIQMLTHSKEKSLVEVGYKKYKDLKKNNIENEQIAMN